MAPEWISELKTQRFPKYGFHTIAQSKTSFKLWKSFCVFKWIFLAGPEKHTRVISLHVISVALKLVSHHCDLEITEWRGRNQLIQETMGCRHKTNNNPKCSNVVESHNWFWITSFSSHASRSWENLEGKMVKFTFIYLEHGAKPWESALPVCPLSLSSQWKKVLWPSPLENWWVWIIVLNNSLIKTFLNSCQLCDSFTVLPPAIPVPVREKEATLLDLQVTYAGVSWESKTAHLWMAYAVT